MKLLEEKGLRNKIINECIKYENSLQEHANYHYKMADNSVAIPKKLSHIQEAGRYVDEIDTIRNLRMYIIQLLDNEKVE